jgi:hypothetical protein
LSTERQWGGARPGAGRRKSDQKKAGFSITLPGDQLVALERYARARQLSRSAALAEILKTVDLDALTRQAEAFMAHDTRLETLFDEE